MADQTPSGLRDFVIRQNTLGRLDGADDSKGPPLKQSRSNDGLKVPVPNPNGKSANTRTMRPNGGLAQQYGESNHSAQNQHQTHRHGILTTEASAADKRSSVGSLRGESRDDLPHGRLPLQNQANQPHTLEVRVGFDDLGQDAPPVHDIYVEQNAQSQLASLRTPDGGTFRRMSGDTYPTTTSGQPSEVDIDEQREQKGGYRGRQQGSQTAAGGTIVQDGRVGTPIQPFAGLRDSNNVTHPQPIEMQPAAASTSVAPAANVMADITSSFRYGAANPKHSNTIKAPPPQQQQQERSTSRQGKQSRTDIAHRGSSIPGVQRQHMDSLKRVQQNAPMPNHPDIFAQQKFQVHPQRRKMIREEPLSELQSEIDQREYESHYGKVDPHLWPSHEDQAQEEEQTSLDYDEHDLYAMGYAELKTQSFDHDPNARGVKLPDEQQAGTLQQKLQFVSKMQPRDQAEFVHSLTMEEWEDAGDWFLDRFREITGKLKDARIAKRQAARAVEDQIEAQHNALSKKQKLIETALSVMRESGGKVLQGTPKKGKQAASKSNLEF